MFKNNKKKYQTQNSRRYKRLPVSFLIKYQVPGNDQPYQVSNMKDLSANGVKFWTDQFLPEGSLVRLNFVIPQLDLTVETLGRVVRVRRAKEQPIFYIATRFIEISEDAMKAIDDFVEFAETTAPKNSIIKRKAFI